MDKAATGYQYILMIRDDHSCYCWFFPDTIITAETANNILDEWSASFGVRTTVMSEGPTHFNNKTLRLLVNQLRSSHQTTFPYSP